MAVQGIRLMALWAKTAQNGETYHEGSLGGCTVRLFVNNYKKTERDPDVIMYLSQKPKPDARVQAYKRDQQQAPAPQAGPPKSRITPRPQAQQPPPKPAYKDWTAQSEGPPDDGMPMPDESDFPPY